MKTRDKILFGIIILIIIGGVFALTVKPGDGFWSIFPGGKYSDNLMWLNQN